MRELSQWIITCPACVNKTAFGKNSRTVVDHNFYVNGQGKSNMNNCQRQLRAF